LVNVLGFLAVTFSTINVVGGYLVTNRMLSMFKRK
jgi:NAD(P) transhydrogenase subunit alpha